MKRSSRKDIYRCASQKQKVKEGLCLPIISAGELVTLDKEKVELFNFLASIFNGNLSSHTSQVGGLQDRARGSKVLPAIREA